MRRAKYVYREEEGRELVLGCESRFRNRLQVICDRTAQSDVRLIALTGPTCAGKSTAAEQMRRTMEKTGRHVLTISLDDFFIDQSRVNLREIYGREEIDFDSVDVLDLLTLERVMKELRTTGRAEVPRFDFNLRKRVGYEPVRIGPDDVLLVEGIQALYPDVCGILRNFPSRFIFAGLRKPLMIGRTLFDPHEIRLMRRIVRDAYRRGTEPVLNLWLWGGVRRNEARHILPYAFDCEELLDTGMTYEVHMLTGFLRPLLGSLPDYALPEHREYARMTLELLEQVEPFPVSYLPADAFYHEFV